MPELAIKCSQLIKIITDLLNFRMLVAHIDKKYIFTVEWLLEVLDQ